MSLVLSLFPGIGLLDMAFEQEGFCVVRGPDLLWGGDIRRFNPPAGRFDGIIGGPPCQAWSRLRHMVHANGYKTAPDLIPEFVRCVREAAPEWFVMENVSEAPTPRNTGLAWNDVLLEDVKVGGLTSRTRRITFGGAAAGAPKYIEYVALHPGPEPTVCASDGGRSVPVKLLQGGHVKVRVGRALLQDRSSRTFGRACELQGLPASFLENAPFTYSAKRRMIGNGVPLPMGRAIARAVRQAIGLPLVEQTA